MKLPTSPIFSDASIYSAARCLSRVRCDLVLIELRRAYQRLNPKRLAYGNYVQQLVDNGNCCCSLGALYTHLLTKGKDVAVPQADLDGFIAFCEVETQHPVIYKNDHFVASANDNLNVGYSSSNNTIEVATERYRIMAILLDRELRRRGVRRAA